jgi:hypothetical protein
MGLRDKRSEGSTDQRRAGQRDGATGRVDPARLPDKDYRRGLSRGRSAEVNRELTGWAGKRNPNR